MTQEYSEPAPTYAQTADLSRETQPRSEGSDTPLLDRITQPSDLRQLPRDQLDQLSRELRADLIDSVSSTGGHFGSGLGVIELTVALHYVFDTPRDKLIWDVSHQCYPHKILTGRRAELRTVRQAAGPSGFTCRQESEFDPFGAAHSSTAISSGLGFAAARDLAGDDFDVVAVVGDGAMSGGMAFEALNNAGAQGRRMTVVLNDNDMSIAPPSGALRTHLSELRRKMPSAAIRRRALRAGELINFVGQPTLFDQLSVRYAGPFDGHDVDELVMALSLARTQTQPTLIHVVTEKGRGFSLADPSPEKLHAVGKFDQATGKQVKAPAGPKTYTNVFAETLIGIADRDDRVVAITAAMPSGTGLDKFGKAHPDKCFDAGIAEQHAVTFAAGLACEGFKPFAAIYSTFLQRAYDQVVHDVAIQKLPVRFAIDRAGLVGADGVTHQGSYDIAYLGCLPDFVLMAASDEAELARMVQTAAAIDDRPSAFRYPRGAGVGVDVDVPDEAEPLEIGRGRIVQHGNDIALLCYGTVLHSALKAADGLAEAGLSATVADARFAKPIDDALVRELAKNHRLLITIEEGSIGGFATQVVDSVTRQRLETCLPKLLPIHLPDRFIQHDSQSAQATAARLDAAAITARILACWRADPDNPRVAQVAAE
ncbi:MAG: 1-deoxy-D-xylulose-5-phosphate synthase [Pseudomonadota bacterium]